MERKKVKSDRWIRLNVKLATFHNALSRRMVEGIAYQIRVIAVNECGIGEPSPMSEQFVPMAPTSEVPTIRKGRLSIKYRAFYVKFSSNLIRKRHAPGVAPLVQLLVHKKYL
jgi:hypothetical protein